MAGWRGEALSLLDAARLKAERHWRTFPVLVRASRMGVGSPTWTTATVLLHWDRGASQDRAGPPHRSGHRAACPADHTVEDGWCQQSHRNSSGVSPGCEKSVQVCTSEASHRRLHFLGQRWLRSRESSGVTLMEVNEEVQEKRKELTGVEGGEG